MENVLIENEILIIVVSVSTFHLPYEYLYVIEGPGESVLGNMYPGSIYYLVKNEIKIAI